MDLLRMCARIGWLVLLIAGARAVLASETPGVTSAAPVLSAQAYGRLPAVADVAISPDGTKLMFAINDETGGQGYKVVEVNSGATVWGAKVGSGRTESERSILRSVGWADDQHATFQMSATFSADRALPAGVIAPGLRRLDVWRAGISDIGRKHDYLLRRDKDDDWGLNLSGLIAPIADAPGEGRLVMYDSPYTDRVMTVFRVNLGTGQLHKVYRGGRDTIDVLLNAQGVPAIRVDSNKQSNRWSIHALEGGNSRLLLQGQSPTGAPQSLVGFTQDGSLAFVDDPDDRGRDVLYTVSAQGGASKVLVESASYDVESAIEDPWTHAVVGAEFYEELATQRFIDSELSAVHARLVAKDVDASVRLLNWSRDRGRFVVYMQRASDSGAYYLYEPGHDKLALIGKRYPQLHGRELGDRLAVNYPARDGVRISAYLTLPAGKQVKGLPLVVLVHGGPTARDNFEFDWWAAFLASRGYAVVQPNYRGSGGYGDAWQAAGYQQWGKLMQSDVEDAVAVLTRSGQADATRVCIVGASYGGYAALAGATLTPARYRCAVSVAGVSDLPMMLRDTELRTGANSMSSDWWRQLIGDRDADEQRLIAMSPAEQAAHVVAPILLIHGANDVVVPIAQSKRMADRLTAAGKQVQFITFPGEDHWLSDGATRVRMLEEIEAFLAVHLR